MAVGIIPPKKGRLVEPEWLAENEIPSFFFGLYSYLRITHYQLPSRHN
jgi:hypothetical protein